MSPPAGRASYPDLSDSIGAEFLGEAVQQVGGKKAQLGGPRWRVGAEDEHAAIERFGIRVRRQLRAHYLRPLTKYSTNRRPFIPPARGKKPAERLIEPLRILPPLTCEPGHRKGGNWNRHAPFRGIGLRAGQAVSGERPFTP